MALIIRASEQTTLHSGRITADVFMGGSPDLPTNTPAVTLTIDGRRLVMSLFEWREITADVEKLINANR